MNLAALAMWRATSTMPAVAGDGYALAMSMVGEGMFLCW